MRADSLSWCLAGRHNAQQSRSLVDHHLHRDLIVGLQELLFVLILVHDAPFRLTLRGTGSAEDSVRWLTVTDVLFLGDLGNLVLFRGSETCSATMLGQCPLPCSHLGSLSRDTCVLLVSNPQPHHRSGHGCTVGLDRDPPV